MSRSAIIQIVVTEDLDQDPPLEIDVTVKGELANGAFLPAIDALSAVFLSDKGCPCEVCDGRNAKLERVRRVCDSRPDSHEITREFDA